MRRRPWAGLERHVTRGVPYWVRTSGAGLLEEFRSGLLQALAPQNRATMLALISRLLDWFRSLFWKEEMELTLVGLQYSGKTTFVNVIAVRSRGSSFWVPPTGDRGLIWGLGVLPQDDPSRPSPVLSLSLLPPCA